MNHYTAHHIGAFIRWMVNGFRTSYMDEYRGDKGFATQQEQNWHNTKTIALGYVGAFIIVMIIGYILKMVDY